MNFAHRLIVCVALLGFANAQAQTEGTHTAPSPKEAPSSERTLAELIKPLDSEDFKLRLDAFNILKKPEFAETITSWARKCVPPQNSECSKRQREMAFDLLDAHAKYVWSNSGPKFLDELLIALKEDKDYSTKFPVMRLLKKGYATKHAELISDRVYARLESAPLPQAEHEVAALLEVSGSFKKELSVVRLNEIFDVSKKDARIEVINYLGDRLQLRRGSLPPQSHVDLAERAFKSKEDYGSAYSSARFFNHMARAGDRRAMPVAAQMIAGTYGTHVINDGVYVIDTLIDSEASQSAAKSEFNKLSTKERAATYKGLANILKTSQSNSERLRTLKVFGTIAHSDAKDLESELLVKCAPAQEACGTSNSRIPATAYLDLLFGGLPVFTTISAIDRSQKIEIDPALMTQAQTLATELSQRITK